MNEPLTEEELLELLRLEKKATEGPWTLEPPDDPEHTDVVQVWGSFLYDGTRGERRATIISQCAPKEDADLIVASRTALPNLVHEVLELRAQVASYRRSLQSLHRSARSTKG